MFSQADAILTVLTPIIAELISRFYYEVSALVKILVVHVHLALDKRVSDWPGKLTV